MHRIPKKVLWLKMDESNDNISFLLAYAPKFYTKIEFETSDVRKFPIQSKIKHIKVARQANIVGCTKAESKVILNILKSKNKHLRVIEGLKSNVLQKFPLFQSLTLKMQDLSSWRVFLRSTCLENLQIESSKLSKHQVKKPSSPMLINYVKSRFWAHIVKLKKINKFQFHLNNSLDELILSFLQKVSTLEPFLSSIKTFEFHFNYIENFDQYDSDFSRIFAHVTTIKIHELSYPSLQKLLKALPYCFNLKKLSILRAMSNPEEQNDEIVDFNYLNNLTNLHNLQTLHLSLNLKSSHGSLSFFQHFSVPSSIKNIILDLQGLNWKALFPGGLPPDSCSSSETFLTNATCTNFYHKWTQLKNLVALNISLSEDEEENDPSFGFFFMLPILRNLETLSSFYYSNSCEFRTQSIDFNDLWQTLKHLTPTLKVLYVEASQISLSNFSLLKGSESGALNKLAFCGNIFGDIKFEKLLNLLSKTPGQNSPHVEMVCLSIKNIKAFDGFLEDLASCPRNIRLSLDLDLRTLTNEDFISMIRKYVSKVNPRNIHKIHFGNIIRLQMADLRELKQIFSQYNLLENVQVSDQEGKRLQKSDDLDLLDYSSYGEDSFLSAAEDDDDDADEMQDIEADNDEENPMN